MGFLLGFFFLFLGFEFVADDFEDGNIGGVADRVAEETIRLRTEKLARQAGSDPCDLFAVFR